VRDLTPATMSHLLPVVGHCDTVRTAGTGQLARSFRCLAFAGCRFDGSQRLFGLPVSTVISSVSRHSPSSPWTSEPQHGADRPGTCRWNSQDPGVRVANRRRAVLNSLRVNAGESVALFGTVGRPRRGNGGDASEPPRSSPST